MNRMSFESRSAPDFTRTVRLSRGVEVLERFFQNQYRSPRNYINDRHYKFPASVLQCLSHFPLTSIADSDSISPSPNRGCDYLKSLQDKALALFF